jgi:hypothetical protein
MLCRVSLCYAECHYVKLSVIMLCSVSLCYAVIMLCCVSLCYAACHYVKLSVVAPLAGIKALTRFHDQFLKIFQIEKKI